MALLALFFVAALAVLEKEPAYFVAKRIQWDRPSILGRSAHDRWGRRLHHRIGINGMVRVKREVIRDSHQEARF